MTLKSRKIVQGLAGLMLMGSVVAWADGGGAASVPPPPLGTTAPAKTSHATNDPWIQHTEGMLEDMKLRLNLSEGQQAAWKVWSGDVLTITREQTERVDHWRNEHDKRSMAQARTLEGHHHLTTPERMTHGLEHMQLEVQRLQDHVALLQKLQATTQVFYDKLDTDQKTIFDLYWQQAYHIGLMLGREGMMDHHGMMGPHAMAAPDASMPR